MTTLLAIGRTLASRRRALGITQRELGERLGVLQPQIARWEADGYESATLARVSAVAEALGVELEGVSLPTAAEAQAAYSLPRLANQPVERALRRLGADAEALAAFCRSHGIVRLEFFGSVLGDDFGPTSDVDVLVTYAPARTPSLFGAVDYERELSAILRRPVDMITRASVERPPLGQRERAILDTATVVYEK